MQRTLAVLACSGLLLSACSKSEPAGTSTFTSSAFRLTDGEPGRDLRMHSTKSRLGALTQLKAKQQLGANPDTVGGTKDPNSGPTGLTYRGGPMLQSPEVYVVLWGKNVAAEVVSALPGFFSTAFNNNAFMSGLQEYNAGTNYVIGNVSYRGLYTDANAPAGVPAPDGSGNVVTDSDVQKELTKLIDQGHLPGPNGHNIFMVYFPPGMIIDQGGGSLSCQVFCAYHGDFLVNGQPVYYGIHPDLTQGPCLQGCGGDTPVNNELSTSSHELIEATTDADVGTGNLAWYDSVDSGNLGGEIGDICTSWTGKSGGYVVQSMWSNESNSCRTAKSTGSATLTIGLNNKPLTPAVLGTTGVDVQIPLTLTVPVGGALTTPATGPFTLATADLGDGFTTSFNPPTLAGSGTSTLTLHIPAMSNGAPLRSQNLNVMIEAIDADGAHHFGEGQVGITGPAPTVTSYTPNSGGGGTQVTVTGTFWGVGSQVFLCPAAGACTTPLAKADGGYVGGTGGKTVVFTAPNVATQGAYRFMLVNLNDSANAKFIDFTYNMPNGGPVITSTSPSGGSPAGGYEVDYSGKNFANGAAIGITDSSGATATVDPTTNNGNDYLWVNSGLILTIMPPGAPGQASIKVTNPAGAGGQVSPAYTGFTYGPSATGLSANMGPTSGGTYVVVDGGGFTNPTKVLFGTAPAKVLSQNASFLTLLTPAHAAGAVDVTVVTDDGIGVKLAGAFTYVTGGAPTISSIDPSWGVTAGGTEVTITGTNLDPSAIVTFDGTPAIVSTGTATSLTLATPPHAAGTVSVVVKNGDGQQVTSNFLYSDTAPVADMAMGGVPTDMATGGKKGGGCSMADGAGSPTGAAALLLGVALFGLALRRRFFA